MAIDPTLIDKLLADYKKPEDIIGKNGFRRTPRPASGQLSDDRRCKTWRAGLERRSAIGDVLFPCLGGDSRRGRYNGSGCGSGSLMAVSC